MDKHIARRHFRESNLSVSESVRQHFVPRFYLASFAVGDLIQACDLEDGREFSASIGDVALIKGFGDVELGGRVVSTEGWLADIEGVAAPIVRRLAAEPATVLSLSEAEQNVVSRFIAAQRFRVPAFREFEQRLAGSLAGEIKKRARAVMESRLPRDEVDFVWEEWEEKPDWWWLQENGPIGDARGAASMLEKVQGFANLVRAMPWRAGWVDSSSSLYTSDNPVSGYLPPARPWWSGGAFAEHAFYFPLSTRALLRFGSLGSDAPLEAGADRCCETFSAWETAFARHVVTAEAIRFLYGPAPYVSRDCARSCLRRLDDARLVDATVLQGFDPRPPRPSSD